LFDAGTDKEIQYQGWCFVMTIELEFLDSVGSEAIASSLEAYDGQVPCIGDLVHLDRNGTWQCFSVVSRQFFFLSPNDKQKISLHCVIFDKERDSFTR
jgi:hypothetical protein